MDATRSLVADWLQWDGNESTRAEVQQLLDQQQWETLTKLMLNRISFGTAGLRGRMGAGFSRMNDLVIIQTTQGWCEWLLKEHSKEAVAEKGVVIGFDNRHGSERFSLLAAKVFVSKGIKVFRFSSLCPTPFVPFGVTHFGCVGGIMVS